MLNTILLGIIATVLVIEFIEHQTGVFLMLKGLFTLARTPHASPENTPELKDVPHVRSGFFQN